MAGEVLRQRRHHGPQSRLGSVAGTHSGPHGLRAVLGVLGEQERQQVIAAGEVIVERRPGRTDQARDVLQPQRGVGVQHLLADIEQPVCQVRRWGLHGDPA